MVATMVAPPPAATQVQRERVTPTRAKLAVIDCDIHNAVPNDKTLLKYLPARWHRYLRECFLDCSGDCLAVCFLLFPVPRCQRQVFSQ